MRSMRPTAPAVRRRPEAAGAIGRAGTAVAIAVLAFTASGCEGGWGGAGPGAGVPPGGGLVPPGLSAAAAARGGRGDADLGHPPEVRGAFGVATIEQRSRTSTERSGRVADHVVRRVRIREIRLR